MKSLLSLLFATLLITGCAGDQVRSDDDQSGAAADTTGGSSSVTDQSSTVVVEGIEKDVSYEIGAINDDNNVLSNKTFYFAFDKSDISSEDQEIIKHHGKYLALNAAATVRIEGHADERGTREYNVALADRRAQAVKRLLTYQGASSKQITVISYGEEKPAALGHDEASWALNRRAEMVYE